jgi:hypothetical protein
LNMFLVNVCLLLHSSVGMSNRSFGVAEEVDIHKALASEERRLSLEVPVLDELSQPQPHFTIQDSVCSSFLESYRSASSERQYDNCSQS